MVLKSTEIGVGLGAKLQTVGLSIIPLQRAAYNKDHFAVRPTEKISVLLHLYKLMIQIC